MAESITTPRSPGLRFWSSLAVSRPSSGYFPPGAQHDAADGDLEGQDEDALEDEEEDEEAMMDEDIMEYDARTALDKTIDRIGMGSYQWTLLSLCGFGWLADNMWIQAVAIILPRVQQHYAVPDSYIGSLSSSMFAGMMFGAVGWGTCSDLMGRSAAFNATLFFTSLFGITASFANSFLSLCILLFFLGSAVGGSMPTDGTLLLEHMPQGKQYLVTALSVFFSFGAVVSAIVAILVVPRYSCTAQDVACDVDVDNKGWQYMLMILGCITLSMFFARMVFFRLHESPRFLVHAGRAQEALESLQMISRFNGSELDLELDDVDDNPPPPCDGTAAAAAPITAPFLSESPAQEYRSLTHGTETIFDADALHRHARETTAVTQSSIDFLQGPSEAAATNYHSTGESPNALEGHGHTLVTPTTESTPGAPGLTVRPAVYTNLTPDVSEFKDALSAGHGTHANTLAGACENTPAPLRTPRPRPRRLSTRRSRAGSMASRRGSMYEMKQKVGGVLPKWMRRPLWAWLDRVAMVMAPQWLRTTLLVWIVWFGVSLAFTMFNVFLPKLLETAASSSAPPGGETPKTLEATLWDVVIFTLGGCPGPILGAYLVETPLGRRGSLAWSTFVTAFFCVVFVLVQGPLAVRASTVGISLSATTMYAVLYGWTPEIFGTKVRGTACGIASALSRVGGMIAPMIGGMLLVVDRTIPVYTSVGVFVLAGICVLMLREDAGDGGRASKERAVMH